MNRQGPQSALREWGRFLRAPRRLIALLGAGLILAIAAPYDTGSTLGPLTRTSYWLLIVLLTYAAGAGVHIALAMSSLPGRVSFPVRLTLSATLTGLVVAAVVLALNAAFFPDRGTWAWLGLAPEVAAIGVIASVVHELARGAHAPEIGPEIGETGGAPGLLDRLPLEKRGDLVALSVEDHYVRVITDRGEEMILMRLSDAMRETGAVRGAQVHRSHWAAFDAVTSVHRQGDRATLTMRTGHEIPVSRANLPRLRDAGLLPR